MGVGSILFSRDFPRMIIMMPSLKSAAEAALARMDAGEETWPLSVVSALVGGENPVCVFRRHRGLKQPAVARAEKGGRTSVAALKALAGALAVDLDDLV